MICTGPIIHTVLISGGSYCSFSVLHNSFYYTYCSKKMWIVQLIFITVLLFLLNVMFSKTRPVTFISTGSNVSTTPIMAMGCRQCLPLSAVQLKGKHCWKCHCRNGVVYRFWLYVCQSAKKTSCFSSSFSNCWWQAQGFASSWRRTRSADMTNVKMHGQAFEDRLEF